MIQAIKNFLPYLSNVINSNFQIMVTAMRYISGKAKHIGALLGSTLGLISIYLWVIKIFERKPGKQEEIEKSKDSESLEKDNQLEAQEIKPELENVSIPSNNLEKLAVSQAVVEQQSGSMPVIDKELKESQPTVEQLWCELDNRMKIIEELIDKHEAEKKEAIARHDKMIARLTTFKPIIFNNSTINEWSLKYMNNGNHPIAWIGNYAVANKNWQLAEQCLNYKNEVLKHNFDACTLDNRIYLELAKHYQRQQVDLNKVIEYYELATRNTNSVYAGQAHFELANIYNELLTRSDPEEQEAAKWLEENREEITNKFHEHLIKGVSLESADCIVLQAMLLKDLPREEQQNILTGLAKQMRFMSKEAYAAFSQSLAKYTDQELVNFFITNVKTGISTLFERIANKEAEDQRAFIKEIVGKREYFSDGINQHLEENIIAQLSGQLYYQECLEQQDKTCDKTKGTGFITDYSADHLAYKAVEDDIRQNSRFYQSLILNDNGDIYMSSFNNIKNTVQDVWEKTKNASPSVKVLAGAGVAVIAGVAITGFLGYQGYQAYNDYQIMKKRLGELEVEHGKDKKKILDFEKEIQKLEAKIREGNKQAIMQLEAAQKENLIDNIIIKNISKFCQEESMKLKVIEYFNEEIIHNKLNKRDNDFSIKKIKKLEQIKPVLLQCDMPLLMTINNTIMDDIDTHYRAKIEILNKEIAVLKSQLNEQNEKLDKQNKKLDEQSNKLDEQRKGFETKLDEQTVTMNNILKQLQQMKLAQPQSPEKPAINEAALRLKIASLQALNNSKMAEEFKRQKTLPKDTPKHLDKNDPNHPKLSQGFVDLVTKQGHGKKGDATIIFATPNRT